MAHFAELDENNVVLRTIVVHNNELMENGQESESKGIAFCQSLFPNTKWKQTSYNRTFRKHYANRGFTYNPQLDAFIPPKPYPDWILDEEKCVWKPLTPYPDDGKTYVWAEEKKNWIEVKL